MSSINLVPTIKDILGGGGGGGSDSDSDSDSGDICYLEKFREFYVGNIALIYYKPGISNCGYNKQSYLKEMMIINEKSKGIPGSEYSSRSSSYHSRGPGSFSDHPVIPLDQEEQEQLEEQESLEEPLEEPSDYIKEKARSISRGIVNDGRNTDFANSLFQMLSYIPEWYVLLEHSKHEYMTILKKLYDEIKKSDRKPINFDGVFECLKQILPKYSENSRDDPIKILKKILRDHKQFKIFNIKKKETFTCVHGDVLNAKPDDMINESVISILNVPTIKGKTISELVTINSEMQLVKDVAKKQCKKNSVSNDGFGPYRRNYEYDFSDTLYLIIYLKRGRYISEAQKHKISLCYNLNIQGTNFILEGYIIKEEPKDHYRYFKFENEKKYIYHDDKIVLPRSGNFNEHEYQIQVTILLYKKSLEKIL
jgi:hypothetical protein